MRDPNIDTDETDGRLGRAEDEEEDEEDDEEEDEEEDEEDEDEEEVGVVVRVVDLRRAEALRLTRSSSSTAIMVAMLVLPASLLLPQAVAT